MKHANKLIFIVATLLLLALSLMGCASKPYSPPASSPTLQLPPAPSVSTPLPPTSYSISAADDIKAWRKRLTGILPTSKP